MSEEDIKHHVLIIKVNQRYNEGMDERSKYNIVRGIWRVSLENVRDIDYVFGVYKGDIIAVYKPTEWYVCKDHPDILPREDIVLTPKNENRLFFLDESFEEGLPADENEQFYINKSIAKLKMNQSAQNPVTYFDGRGIK